MNVKNNPSIKKQKRFTQDLMLWFSKNHRPLPWKGEKNPYYIWLSEIILQQTRVEQGLPYFERFKKKYPKIEDLANAPEDEVMKLWEGLGYYSRARNLHATAKIIANDLNGVFPKNYKDILQLKGIGPYTAAAISSFAYGLPNAVVDGNVYRVLARFFGIETPMDSSKGKKEFSLLAQTLLDVSQPGNYNQAIMDFGAVHCKPKSPVCKNCLMQKECTAFQTNKVSTLPIKSKKLIRKNRFFNYIIFNEGEDVFIRKRIEKDIWKNLYEFPLIETTEIIEKEKLFKEKRFAEILGETKYKLIGKSRIFKQTLTHQNLIAVFWEVEVKNTFLKNKNDFVILNRKNLDNFAFPKIIGCYLKDNSLHLELF